MTRSSNSELAPRGADLGTGGALVGVSARDRYGHRHQDAEFEVPDQLAAC